MSWPVAYVQRLWHRASDVHNLLAAKAKFFHRLRFSQFDTEFLDWLHNVTQYIQPVSPHRGRQPEGMSFVWQPLPYHPALQGRFNRALRELQEDPLVLDLLDEAFQGKFVIRFAWSLRGQAFGAHLVAW